MVEQKGITYKDAGVDIDEGERFVKIISPLVKETFRREVLTGIGGFGSLFSLDTSRYTDPVLVSGTDGVGTKLKIAFMVDRHDTVGIDLVAMCVNDILTLGAEPLFFLDYFATGKLNPEKASEVVKGIARGCLEAGCSLIGGETAEMPGFYDEGEYDLSGFAVGVVNRDCIIDGSKISPEDHIIGIKSNGLHSNGFSLVRKLFFEVNRYSPEHIFEELGVPLWEELLRPTRIYVKGIKKVLESKIPVKGMAHITGGGISGNLVRILPDGVRAEIDRSSLPELPIFSLIRNLGMLDFTEMEKTFNIGTGFIIISEPGVSDSIMSILKDEGYEPYLLGIIKEGQKGVFYV
ncbi:MAG: phosphoribosylformylglycinamidine cyclo-ligase [Nitrospirae bacterium]|nr:MAG: phosphoribosylformylglycinamidine cyclo-ligase [Nitrospirota bacterium]